MTRQQQLSQDDELADAAVGSQRTPWFASSVFGLRFGGKACDAEGM
jgi:hypothetical protein